jgi:hypothetical protein
VDHAYTPQVEPLVKAVVNNTIRRPTVDQMELPTVKDSLVGETRLTGLDTDATSSSESDIGYLDIPAFLRRQAD